MSSPTFLTPSAANSQGYSTQDYAGSYQEWLWNAARTLAENYARGIRDFDNFSGSTSGIGQPNASDFGAGRVSDQTYSFFQNYLQSNSGDPWIASQFGTAPGRGATYTNAAQQQIDGQRDIYGTFAQRSAFDAQQGALDRQSALDVANVHAGATVQAAQIGAAASNYAADQQLAGVRARVEGDWRIAVLQDATQRYVAEGTWGVQKYVAELQEKGAMDRLKLELGFKDKELAQRALEAKNQHHEAMVALTLEVAKYDQQLAAQPRNWVAYASWLQNRGQVVNALNLATVAASVPESQISPAEVANSGAPGAGIAATQEAQTQAEAERVTAGNMTPEGAAPVQAPDAQAPKQNEASPAPGPVATQSQYSVNGIDLSNTNYSDLANQLLGLGGGGGAPPTTEQLQAAYDSTATAGDQHQPGFQGWGGASTNRLGMNVNANGAKEVWSRFSKLLPSQQEMRVGAVESTGKYAPDFIEEMNRARPKGNPQGAAAWG